MTLCKSRGSGIDLDPLTIGPFSVLLDKLLYLGLKISGPKIVFCEWVQF